MAALEMRLPTGLTLLWGDSGRVDLRAFKVVDVQVVNDQHSFGRVMRVKAVHGDLGVAVVDLRLAPDFSMGGSMRAEREAWDKAMGYLLDFYTMTARERGLL